MHSSLCRANAIPLALLALLGCAVLRSDSAPPPDTRMGDLPRIILWAWERREDLHAIDTKRFAVAYLDSTVTIGQGVEAQPRHSALFFPASARRMPVVRVEADRDAVLNDTNRETVVEELLAAAREPGIAAFQVDFDATHSQRTFYGELLRELRARMPARVPLSMTALASWCSWDDWIRELPVQEAVPMLFRMEPDHRRTSTDVSDFQIREPLCRGAVGVSTAEPWPDEMAGKRVYVFPDRGWREDRPDEIARRLE